MVFKLIRPSLAALALAAATSTGADYVPKWHSDYDAAVAAGISSHRPILILFDAPSTSVRRKNLLPDLDASADFIQFAKAQELVMGIVPPPGSSRDISVERHNRQLRANHGVQSLPAIVLLDSDGRTLGSPTLRSNQSARELVRSIQRLIPATLVLQETNAAPTQAGALVIDLTGKSEAPSGGAATLDLDKMRREGKPSAHPAIIDMTPGEVSGTNVINRRMPP